jgi:serine phosphatase RsbU (regulator of sigma subunit)/tetratricopeptide (TPR) repeat protein
MSNLTGHLAQLENSGLIRLAQIEPDLEYLFRHALVQDAAYDSLLPGDRKRLHQAVGQAVEQLYTERLDELAAMLALHFQRAGKDDRALHYFVQAAETALKAYANQEAENLYRNALALTCTEERRASLLAGLGEALYRQSRFEEAIQVWQEGIEGYRGLEDTDGMAHLYARSARAAWYADDTPRGLKLCQEGLESVAGAPESAEQARLLHEAGRAYHFNGQPEQARPLCRRALEMAEKLGAVDVQTDALATLGVLPDQRAESSLAALKKAVELAEEAGLLSTAARAHHNLGIMISELVGDLASGREHFLQAAKLSRTRGVVSEEALSRMSAIGHSLTLGDLAAAQAGLTSLEDLAQALPSSDAIHLEMQSIRAALFWTKGEWPQALRLLRLCQAEARQRGNLQMLLNTNTQLAFLLLEVEAAGQQIDWAEVETTIRETIEIVDRGLGDRVWPRCLLSATWARQGRSQEAKKMLAEARAQSKLQPSAWHEQSLRLAEAELALSDQQWDRALVEAEAVAAFQIQRGRRWTWAQTLRQWAEIHLHRGAPADLEQAQTLLREARAAFREMGATGYIDRVNDQLEIVRAKIQAQAAAHGQAVQELAVAGRIQAGLLPAKLPDLPGWKFAAALEPARETSGDFYDFIPLTGGRMGLVVADVADKGAGAALYMALSRTLIRTYAAQFSGRPAQVLAAVNGRIVDETDTEMFVTVFYGVLDPNTGVVTYANAGHNPPFLLRGGDAGAVQALEQAGMALGVVHEAVLTEDSVILAPGDSLLLYTDGATDAQGADGELFGAERLLDVALAQQGRSAPEMQQGILAEIHRFVGNAPRFDDLTLAIVTRERSVL